MRVLKYCVENIEQYIRHENKVSENKVLSYWEAFRYVWNIKNNWKVVLIMSILQTQYHVKLDVQKVDQHTGIKDNYRFAKPGTPLHHRIS